MKKIIILFLAIIIVILIAVLYGVYVKSACKTPYREMFVIYQDKSGAIFDSLECNYVGWKN